MLTTVNPYIRLSDYLECVMVRWQPIRRMLSSSRATWSGSMCYFSSRHLFLQENCSLLTFLFFFQRSQKVSVYFNSIVVRVYHDHVTHHTNSSCTSLAYHYHFYLLPRASDQLGAPRPIPPLCWQGPNHTMKGCRPSRMAQLHSSRTTH